MDMVPYQVHHEFGHFSRIWAAKVGVSACAAKQKSSKHKALRPIFGIFLGLSAMIISQAAVRRPSGQALRAGPRLGLGPPCGHRSPSPSVHMTAIPKQKPKPAIQ
jgi:hypothetical protein